MHAKTPRYIVAGMLCHLTMWVLIGFTIAGTCIPHASAAAPLRDPDVQVLIRAEMFAFGGIGFTGVTTGGEIALLNLCAKPDAIELLRAVVENANEVGRCYALVGLRELDREKFTYAYWAMYDETPPIDIPTASGCIVERTKLHRILRQIKAGDFACRVRQAIR